MASTTAWITDRRHTVEASLEATLGGAITQNRANAMASMNPHNLQLPGTIQTSSRCPRTFEASREATLGPTEDI